MTIEGYQEIWCNVCLKATPFEVETGGPSADILCLECRFVIATLHTPKQESESWRSQEPSPSTSQGSS